MPKKPEQENWVGTLAKSAQSNYPPDSVVGITSATRKITDTTLSLTVSFAVGYARLSLMLSTARETPILWLSSKSEPLWRENMERADVIEQSIKVLIGIAQTLTLGVRAIEEIVDQDFVDGEVYVLVAEIKEHFEDIQEAVEYELKDQQIRALYGFEGSTVVTDCPLCGREMIELDDCFLCTTCGFEET